MYLVIDRTTVNAIRGVVESGGKRVGTTRMLDPRDLGHYAKWLGAVGGRDLLDAFEVQLINDGMLFVRPVDVDGVPLHDECKALEIRHYDDGSRIVWEPQIECTACDGDGHFALPGDPIREDDLCAVCDGSGHMAWGEFETDMDGNPLPLCNQGGSR